MLVTLLYKQILHANFQIKMLLLSWYHKNGRQTHICVMTKLTKIVLDKQNFKCLPNNAFRLAGAVKMINLSDCYSHQFMQ